MTILKCIKPEDVISQKLLLRIISLPSTEKIYGLPIDSDIKRYKKIRKLTTVQCEGYTTECFLDCDYIKNHYRQISVGLSRQKQIDTAPEAIHQINVVGQLKNWDDATVANESMFDLTFLEKIK